MATSSIPHANVVSFAGGTRSRVAAAFRVAARLTLLRVPFDRSRDGSRSASRRVARRRYADAPAAAIFATA